MKTFLVAVIALSVGLGWQVSHPIHAAAAMTADQCVAAKNVWVIVEDDTSSKGACATSFKTGEDALKSAGFVLTSTGGFLEKIDGIPGDYGQPGVQKWWSYWQSDVEDGKYSDWKFSALGMTSYRPLAGSIEAWRLQPSYSGTIAPSPHSITPPAPEPVESGDVVDIPDAEFKSCLAQHLAVPTTAQLTKTQLASLTELECFYAGITDLSGAEHLSKLALFDLTFNKVTDLAPLAGLASLTTLVLDGNPLKGEIGQLSGLTNLQKLDLTKTGLTSLAPLASLTSLRDLEIDSNGLTSLAGLEKLTKLEHLNAASNAIDDLSPVSGLPLTKLQVYKNSLTSLQTLGASTTLVELNVHSNKLTSLNGVEKLPNLTTLLALTNQITSLDALAPSSTSRSTTTSQLTSLSISNNPLTSIEPLAQLSNLTELNAQNNGISDVTPLAGLTKLSKLYLHDNAITDLSPLKDLPLTSWGALKQVITLDDAVINEPAPLPVVLDRSGQPAVLLTLAGSTVSEGSVTHTIVGTTRMSYSGDGLNRAAKFTGTIHQAVVAAAPEPSEDPTPDPTDEPTVDPTDDPTDDPTTDPTDDPTTDPTDDPTDDPTTNPSDDPTAEPTDDPTTEPTTEPSSDPTEESGQTSAPVVSTAPTSSQTTAPAESAAVPTAEPTAPAAGTASNGAKPETTKPLLPNTGAGELGINIGLALMVVCAAVTLARRTR